MMREHEFEFDTSELRAIGMLTRIVVVPKDALSKNAWIRFELSRRGHNYKTLAKQSGVSYSCIRQAISTHKPLAERVIARAISVDPSVIWPDRYEPKCMEARDGR